MQNTNAQEYNEYILQCRFGLNVSVFILFQFHVEVAMRTQHSPPRHVGIWWTYPRKQRIKPHQIQIL